MSREDLLALDLMIILGFALQGGPASGLQTLGRYYIPCETHEEMMFTMKMRLHPKS